MYGIYCPCLKSIFLQEEFFVTEFQEEQESVATTDMGSVMTNDKDDDDLFLKPKTPVRVSRTSRRSVESSLTEAVNSLNNVQAKGDGGSVMPSVISAVNGEGDVTNPYNEPPPEDIFSEEPSDVEDVDDGSAGSTNESSSFDDLAEDNDIKQ